MNQQIWACVWMHKCVCVCVCVHAVPQVCHTVRCQEHRSVLSPSLPELLSGEASGEDLRKFKGGFGFDSGLPDAGHKALPTLLLLLSLQ